MDEYTAEEKKMLKKIQSRRGQANVEKHGIAHMRTIGRKGGEAGKGVKKPRKDVSTPSS